MIVSCEIYMTGPQNLGEIYTIFNRDGNLGGNPKAEATLLGEQLASGRPVFM